MCACDTRIRRKSACAPRVQVFAANLRAMQEMRRSRVFRRCLRAALDAGNFLNFGR